MEKEGTGDVILISQYLGPFLLPFPSSTVFMDIH